jgi:putative heme transporter
MATVETERPSGSAGSLRRAGRLAWAVLGILGVLVVLGILASRITLVIVPVILALFPATLLVPIAAHLKRVGFPEALASLLTILGAILLFVGVVGAMVPLVIRETPGLAESAGEGIREIEEILQRVAPGFEIGGMTDVLDMIQAHLGEAGDIAAQAFAAGAGAFETLAGLALLFVSLFFYLKDGRRLFDGIALLVPVGHRRRFRGAADRAWDTLGSYFRGQLLVAFVDAVAIGIGLWILGVPLVLPLSLLIFFGGLFPIVGAVVTGSLAVLVALAHGGLILGLIVTGLVLAVQQLEGNVLEPLILSHVIHLHPLVIILSITAGSLLLGLLGAFLAVPTAAIVSRTLSYLNEPAP